MLRKPPSSNEQAPAITRRDGYIVGQALYWFIREQQSLPKERFEWSNAEDAKPILLTLYPSLAEHFAQEDVRLGRAPANLDLEKYDRMLPTLLAADNIVRLNH